jgi:hypothetical protein
MPADKHAIFRQPDDPESVIWRYMDFTKFVSTLETRALYFARSDTLGDPFEGSLSRGNEVLRPLVYKGIQPETLKLVASHKATLGKDIRMSIFINCWHMNAGESAAMWKLYAKSNEAVAIRSTFSKLESVLDKECYVGLVDYIDFKSDWIPEGNFFSPYVHKRKSFAHESEVRALILKVPEKEGKPDFHAPQLRKGIPKVVPIEKLIDAVYVAPTSPRWFHELVEQVLLRYGLKLSVTQSSLDEEPFF